MIGEICYIKHFLKKINEFQLIKSLWNGRSWNSYFLDYAINDIDKYSPIVEDKFVSSCAELTSIYKKLYKVTNIGCSNDITVSETIRGFGNLCHDSTS